MPLYYLEIRHSVDYDEYDSFVVRASSEQAARQLLVTAESDYGDPDNPGVQLPPRQRGIFATSEGSTCTLLDSRGPARIICSSFNAG